MLWMRWMTCFSAFNCFVHLIGLFSVLFPDFVCFTVDLQFFSFVSLFQWLGSILLYFWIWLTHCRLMDWFYVRLFVGWFPPFDWSIYCLPIGYFACWGKFNVSHVCCQFFLLFICLPFSFYRHTYLFQRVFAFSDRRSYSKLFVKLFVLFSRYEAFTFFTPAVCSHSRYSTTMTCWFFPDRVNEPMRMCAWMDLRGACDRNDELIGMIECTTVGLPRNSWWNLSMLDLYAGNFDLC